MGEGIPARSGSYRIASMIQTIDPEFGVGLNALNDVLHSDGALDARDKALLLVAGAAVRDVAGTAPEVERAIGLGVEPAELEALALALYLSRGAGPCRAVLDCLPDRADHDGIDHDGIEQPAAQVTIPSVSEMVDGFRQIFGEIPDRIALLAEMSPGGLTAYHLMRDAVLGSGTLDPIIAELALVTVNACEHRSDFAVVHVRGARRVGATDEQLVEAGLCAIPSGGVAAWLAASEAIVADRPPTPSTDPSNQR